MSLINIGNLIRKEGAMINILLSVRRPYSRYILNDEKHDEVRKTAPLKFKRGNTTIYLYESGKNGNHAIIGKCEMYGASLVTESRGENAIRILAAQARVGFAELVNYLPCWDWGIGAPELFLNAVPLSAIGLTRPPQSWQYLTPDQAAILERRGSEHESTP
jgi:predicted transcriptional regulator